MTLLSRGPRDREPVSKRLVPAAILLAQKNGLNPRGEAAGQGARPRLLRFLLPVSREPAKEGL